jgi:chorismate mutase
LSKKRIEDIRREIDEVDSRLLFLFNRRADLVLELSDLKKSAGKDVYDPFREKDIFVRITERNPGPLSPDSIVRIFEQIIEESRRLQKD